MNFAAVWQAPVVFLCQNNGWAISTPRSKQTRTRTIAQKAIAFGMPGIQVDGNDPLAVYSATRQALARAKDGGGPTLIEAVTYRLMMHTTSDDPTRYRKEEHVREWWKREPLVRTRLFLEKRGVWNAEKQAALEVEIKKEVEEAVTRYEAHRDFKPDAPFDHVFGTKDPWIEGQRKEFLLNHARQGQGEARHG
jgi:pyruvate dehydrogenase E1 component alpha subunit